MDNPDNIMECGTNVVCYKVLNTEVKFDRVDVERVVGRKITDNEFEVFQDTVHSTLERASDEAYDLAMHPLQGGRYDS